MNTSLKLLLGIALLAGLSACPSGEGENKPTGDASAAAPAGDAGHASAAPAGDAGHASAAPAASASAAH